MYQLNLIRWMEITSLQSTDESHKVDRITSLPDCVTSNILSRLVAEEAMRTSVLSRDWRHKWTSIYNVDITVGSWYTFHKDYRSFYSFVDRVLDCNPDLNLGIFRLNLSNTRHPTHHLERWVSKALGRGVNELKLEASDTKGNFVFERPTSLTKLHFVTKCTLTIRIENCFPSLKHLYLCGIGSIKIKNEQSPNTGELSLTFPVLEQLELLSIKFLKVKSVTINAPKLTSLKTRAKHFLDLDIVIKIFAPKLREFISDGGELYNIVLQSPSLYSAVLVGHLGSWSSGFVASRASLLLKGVRGLKCLKLSCNIMKVLAEGKGVYGFPIFDRLTRLTLEGNEANGLMELLEATPNLEYLTLDVRVKTVNPFQENLPRCIVSQLKRVHLCTYTGERFQNDVAMFFLENAKKLKRVYLCHYFCDDLKKAEMKSWISGLGPHNASRIKFLRNCYNCYQ